MRPPKYDWDGTVLPAAAAFVDSFGDIEVTLRQVYYYLGSRAIGGFSLTPQDYDNLSAWTTKRRDEGKFPDLADNTRWISRYPYRFTSADQAQAWLRQVVRRDRAEFADVSIYLGVEKAGLLAQLAAWFEPLGIPILPLGGWSSQTFREQVRREIVADGRPAVLIYAGDFDPAGDLIGESFANMVGVFDRVIRVGLNIDHISALPANPFPMSSKGKHSLIPRFKAKYGKRLRAMGLADVVQYELDALNPDQLRALYRDALRQFFDGSAFMRSRQLERAIRDELEERWS